jgi:multiple sugar transport system permease protein
MSSGGRKAYSWPAFALLAAGTVLVLFPFVWMLLSAFKTNGDVYAYPPRWIPSAPHWGNFRRVFEMVPFGLYFWNSLSVSAVLTASQIAISILAAYAFAKLRFPLKGGILVLVLSTMLMPQVVTIVPMFLVVARMGLVDTYGGLILPEVFSGFTIIMLQQFFMAVPDDLMHAARIDGCGWFRSLAHVILPNSSSAIATATLFAFLAHWRSYLWPLIVVNSTKLRTLPIGLKYLMSESATEYQVMMAASVMAIVPVLIVFSFTEKYFVRSIALSGLKA